MQKQRVTQICIDCTLCAVSLLLYTLSLFLFPYYSERVAIDFVLLAIVVADLAIGFFAFKNLRRHVVLFVFTVCFNILLLGRVFTTSVENYDNLYAIAGADNGYQMYIAVSLVYLSLAAVFLAYRLSGLFFKKQEDKIGQPCTHRSDRLIPIVRVLTLIVLTVTFGFELYQLIVNVQFVLTNGYLHSFVAKPTTIPYFVRITASLFFPAFVLYLATKPTVKQLIYPVILYAVTSGLSVLTGRRNQFVCAVLLMLIYIVMRDDFRTGTKFISKIKVLLCGVLGMVGVFLLQGMRSGFKTPFFESLFNFIYDQGASFAVVIKTVIHKGAFSDTPFRYLTYPIDYMLNNSFLGDTLFKLPQIVEVQTETFVATTFNYAHKLTFLSDPQRYLSGGGYGASFVADGYIVGGIVGVLLIGLLLGVLIRFLPSLLTRPFPVIGFGLIFVRYVVYIPRNFALGWIVDAANPSTLLLFGGIYLTAFLLDRYKAHIPILKDKFGG